MCDLKKKFTEWKEWLFGEDVHSIRNQIHRMTWDCAVFLCVKETRKYASLDEKGEPKLNPMIHHFINSSFLQTQALAIRRLLDARPKGDVWSLYCLISDMENYCELLTRENILKTHDYPYDYKAEEERLLQLVPPNKPVWLPQEYQKCVHSEHIHKSIDNMLNITAGNRKPDDKIPNEIFAWLKNRLDSCKKIYDYVNKFLAHSAAPESRVSIKADEIKITLGHILNAHEIICQIAEFIGINFLNRSLGDPLAVPQYDQFEHFEKPWATEETIRKLYEFWHDYDQKTRQWANWDWQAGFNQFIGSN